MRILIVEDSLEFANLIKEGLARNGYDADCVSDIADARAAVAAARPVAMILDLGLPDGNGLTLLREMRDRQDPLPVIILTARGSVSDRVTGLRSGADDYLVKPFAFEELVARIEAVLRRPGQFLGRSLKLGNLVLDTVARQTSIEDKPHSLAPRELAILELLMRRPGQVVPKRMVEDQLFGLGGDVGSNAVEVYVHRLRKQLTDAGSSATITTVRGVGYLITSEH
jgi:two-component system response regulator TctD